MRLPSSLRSLQAWLSAASERIARFQDPVQRRRPGVEARLDRQYPPVHGPVQEATRPVANHSRDSSSWISASESAFDRIEAIQNRSRFNAPVVLNPPPVRATPRAVPAIEDLGD